MILLARAAIYLTFFGLLAALCGDASAQGVWREAEPEQFSMSCGLGPVSALTLTTVGDAEQLRTAAGTTSKRLFKWGEQWKATASGGDVLICAHQTLTATVSLGVGSACGDDCGYAVFDSANTTAGQVPCALIKDGGFDYLKISSARFQSTADPTYRACRCTTIGSDGVAALGGGCLNASDGTTSCGGSGGVCSCASRPRGVYLSAIPLTAGAKIILTECPQ